MINPRLMKGGAIAVACAIVGAVAGIAGSAAAPAHKAQAPSGTPLRATLGGPPVHSETVVPNQSNGFDTITMDRGSFRSLSGNQLTITEGTKTATYKVVNLTIPANATVRRNGASAALTDIKAGDEVTVLQTANGTFVNAEDATHQAARGPGRFGFGRGRFFGPYGPRGSGHGRWEGPPASGTTGRGGYPGFPPAGAARH
jgi:hypothetical protein